MYRYWLCHETYACEVFDLGQFEDSDGDDDDFDEDAYFERKEEFFTSSYKRLLDPLSNDELFEILNVSVFCHDTIVWQEQAFSSGESLRTVCLRPLLIVQIYLQIRKRGRVPILSL